MRIIIKFTILFTLILFPLNSIAQAQTPGVYISDQLIAGQGVFFNQGTYMGGGIVAGNAGITVRQIRFGKHTRYERLVFDFYDCQDSGPTQPKLNVSTFSAGFAQKLIGKVRITARVGWCEIDDFSSSSLIERIEETEYFDWVNYMIYFKEPVEIAVMELSDPGRVVIDIRKK